MDYNDIKPGFAYHIKDDYFAIANDPFLMQNKEGGSFRPTYLCIKDEKTALLWVVPMSTRFEKYKVLYDKDILKYGKSIKIVLGKYGGKNAAFLIQNMFPLAPQYIDHYHTIKGNPIPINPTVQNIIESNVKNAYRMNKKGIKIVFPDILRLEKVMLEEINKVDTITMKPSIEERLQKAKIKAKELELLDKAKNIPHIKPDELIK